MELTRRSNRFVGQLMPLAALLLSLSGCRAVTGIFRAGIWVGVIVVALVAILLFGALKLVRRGTSG